MEQAIERIETKSIASGQVAGALIDVIARAARDPAVDVQKMKELIDIQERLLERQAQVEFNGAMARLQPRLPAITKDGHVQYSSNGKPVSFSFATYEKIDEIIRPILCDEGFSLSFNSFVAESGATVYTGTLSHAAGHERLASIILPPDTSGAKNSIQSLGSTVSYAKRYLVGMLLNIVTRGEDTDGNYPLGYVSEGQKNNIIDMMAACEMGLDSERKFLALMQAHSVGQIYERDYNRAMQMLGAKKRQVEGGRA